ncbi:hypothetical protein M413DRAFT_212016 [Hebeloma cylindrosporum]|uniref:Uncharacterized protein n=1 Tax=Hebeloma cylindrosporum TaxID=76867 RepID=A0A0C3CGJ2_HEBCY|nr:hypothetical protein M413DRAFT_212016 [Hebeloma cylindrosporum h7]
MKVSLRLDGFSRLFSSTRRLFGSPSPSPAPNQTPSPSSVTPLAGRSATLPANSIPTPPPQQRRLAEFGTVLGDFKLAVTVWEALRKEAKGGSVRSFLQIITTTLQVFLRTSFRCYSRRHLPFLSMPSRR